MCLHTCNMHFKSMVCAMCHVSSMRTADNAYTTTSLRQMSMLDRNCRVPVYTVLQKLPLEHPSSYEKKCDSPVMIRCQEGLEQTECNSWPPQQWDYPPAAHKVTVDWTAGQHACGT